MSGKDKNAVTDGRKEKRADEWMVGQEEEGNKRMRWRWKRGRKGCLLIIVNSINDGKRRTRVSCDLWLQQKGTRDSDTGCPFGDEGEGMREILSPTASETGVRIKWIPLNPMLFQREFLLCCVDSCQEQQDSFFFLFFVWSLFVFCSVLFSFCGSSLILILWFVYSLPATLLKT